MRVVGRKGGGEVEKIEEEGGEDWVVREGKDGGITEI